MLMVCDGCCKSDSNLLESLQIEGARVVTRAFKGTNRVSLLNNISWVELSVGKKKIHKLTVMYKMLFKLAPPYLFDLCPNFVCERSSYSLCSANNLCLPFVRTERHKKSFLFSSTQEWYNLPLETRKLSSPGIFKRSLLKFLHFPSGSYLFCIGDRLA